jgi:activator of 2-hydroxyglutaryl-CoA dehydratase
MSARTCAGLDIGSRTIALVVWDGARIVRAEVVDTGTDPLNNARSLLAGEHFARLVATGYGRHLAAERALADEVISEIKAYAIGAFHLFPDVGTVLDIGGQDSKVIRVGPRGQVLRFEMNDRCAAGTGRFLENMARTLGLAVEQFGPHALEGLHQAIVDRVGSMIRRVGVQERFVFAGGVAHNPCLQTLFAEALNVPLSVPDDPQTVGALGAALHAWRTMNDE